MRAIMVMFDSLNRRMLPPYGCDWVHAPNFQRLAERTVVFDNSYTCSLPCMPARRELHTGRPNLLHRSWGPVEPFDDSMPEILRLNGIHSHLSTDHYHYWEDGGATYHNRYKTYQMFRGQEGDSCNGWVGPVEVPENCGGRDDAWWWQDWINRMFMDCVEKQPQPQTFNDGLKFIRNNYSEDNWFLHIETFDPHEPFFTHQKYKDLYPHEYKGKHFDWPCYRKVEETPEEVQHCRYEYAALVSMCDDHLGKVLDMMDNFNMWDDTMLIVNTDHGFLLGEHDCWAKCWAPFYNEVAHTPLFIWDPRCGIQGERRQSLVQTIDLAPTVLEFFNVEIPKDMIGKPLKDTVAHDAQVREAGMFGQHGAHVNVTDGRYVYMRGPVVSDNQPLNEYTLMPTHMRDIFDPEELQDIHLAEPFPFTKGCRTMKIGTRGVLFGSELDARERFPTMLFDLEKDPDQLKPFRDEAIEKKMMAHLKHLMDECDAPEEQYIRLGMKDNQST